MDSSSDTQPIEEQDQVQDQQLENSPSIPTDPAMPQLASTAEESLGTTVQNQDSLPESASLDAMSKPRLDDQVQAAVLENEGTSDETPEADRDQEPPLEDQPSASPESEAAAENDPPPSPVEGQVVLAPSKNPVQAPAVIEESEPSSSPKETQASQENESSSSVEGQASQEKDPSPSPIEAEKVVAIVEEEDGETPTKKAKLVEDEAPESNTAFVQCED